MSWSLGFVVVFSISFTARLLKLPPFTRFFEYCLAVPTDLWNTPLLSQGFHRMAFLRKGMTHLSLRTTYIVLSWSPDLLFCSHWQPCHLLISLSLLWQKQEEGVAEGQIRDGGVESPGFSSLLRQRHCSMSVFLHMVLLRFHGNNRKARRGVHGDFSVRQSRGGDLTFSLSLKMPISHTLSASGMWLQEHLSHFEVGCRKCL